jgi:hypothetical protein
MTPEGSKALDRTVENDVGLAELLARHSGRKKWKESLLRLLRGAV